MVIFQKGIDTFWEIENREKEYVQFLEGIIRQGLLDESDNIFIKYLWMKDKYNHMISELKRNKQITAGGFTLGRDKQDSFYKNLELIENDRF